MSYTVLARKYRSRTLDEVVGQEPIVVTLKNAIASGRLHHGYLFCGTRGVGKTSTARVLAKSINCLSHDRPQVTPCLECDSCRAIAEGADIDVLEIDAASNTGVDHVRELRSNANYRPARARYKIYIIDEVHMLSTGAFNALLKILEEPPDHVKFIFATTEQQKVPATIQSRVQRFEFKSIPPAVIAAQIERILAAENIEAEPEAVRRVARAANGSMRDALSLLDQLLSDGAAQLRLQTVEELLPAQHDEQISSLIDAVLGADAAAALGLVDDYLTGGRTIDRLCDALIEQLRTLMILRVCGPKTELVDVPRHALEAVHSRSQRAPVSAYVYMISALEELRRQARSSATGRALADAVIVRLCSAGEFSAISDLLAGLSDEEGPKKKVAPPPRTARPPAEPPAAVATAAPPPVATAAPAAVITAAPAALVTAPRPAASPPKAAAAAAVRSAVSTVEVSAARSDPLVREALSIFDGTLVNVQRAAGSAGGSAAPREQ